jgi:hypothetical protein
LRQAAEVKQHSISLLPPICMARLLVRGAHFTGQRQSYRKQRFNKRKKRHHFHVTVPCIHVTVPCILQIYKELFELPFLWHEVSKKNLFRWQRWHEVYQYILYIYIDSIKDVRACVSVHVPIYSTVQ